MAAPAAEELAAVEERLNRLLDPYRDRLEAGTIYGIPTLRRRGAKAHDWFAFVKPASKHVSLFLMPMLTWPELLDACSPGLARARKAKTAFNFSALDDQIAAELEALVARAYERYVAG
jgi:hypothetical protein